MRLGVTHKLWLSILVMAVLILVPVGIALDQGITRFYYDQNSDDMLELGGRLADFLVRAPDPGASEAVRAIAQIAGTPLLVLDERGIVTSGTGELSSEVGRELQTAQIRAALAGNPTVVLAVNETLPGSLFVAAVPILARSDAARSDPARSEPRGAVLLFRQADAVRQAVAEVRTLLFLAACGLLVLLSGLGWLLSRRVARPLLLMRNAADRMAHGEYAAQVQAAGGDELGDLAEAINRLGESLHTLETGRRAFFANVSHELRTPLSYLRGYSEALAQGLAGSESEVKEYGRIVTEESQRLSRLVDDLFELAQAEEGRLSLRIVPVDVETALRRVVDRVRAEGARKGIRIDTSCEEGACVMADPDRFEQIVMNLLDNALRHTPQGGDIRVAATRRDPGGAAAGGGTRHAADARGGAGFGPNAEQRGMVPTSENTGELKPGAGEIVITVEDSGPGLQGDAEQVWERFYRGERSRNRGLGGSGLGLSIVKSLVESQAGRVWAEDESALGGASVNFALPRATGEAH